MHSGVDSVGLAALHVGRVCCDNACVSGVAMCLLALARRCAFRVPLGCSICACAYACGRAVSVLPFARLPLACLSFACLPATHRRRSGSGTWGVASGARATWKVRGVLSHPPPPTPLELLSHITGVVARYCLCIPVVACVGRPGDRTVSVATVCLCLLDRGEAASTAERNGLTASWKQLFPCVYELCWA
jgi:hypothetical protein